MQRYFTEERKEDVCFLNEEDSYHLQVVMRKKEEDLVEDVKEIIRSNFEEIKKLEKNPKVKRYIHLLHLKEELEKYNDLGDLLWQQ